MSGKFFSRTLSFVLAVVLVPSVAEAQVTATWNGAGDGSSYSDAANWDIGVVPLDGGGTNYEVVIPSGFGVNFDVVGLGNEVFQISVGANSTLTIEPARELQVSDEAAISGTVINSGGDFLAPSSASQFPGNAILSVDDGGTTQIAAGSFTTTSTTTVFAADGSGTLLNLSSLQSLSAPWNDSSGTARATSISATNGASLDLSGVQSINAPVRGEDRFDITIGAGSQIDLSSLTTTTSSSAGDTRFSLQDATPYTLPALTNASNAQFRLVAGTTFNLPMLTTHSSGDYVIPAGSTVNANNLQSLTSATITIDPNGVFNATSLTDLSGSVVTVTPDRTLNTAFIATLDDAQVNVADGIVYDRIAATSYTSNLSRTAFSADGAGTELDLSSLQSLSAPWNDSSGTVRATTISATNGALIDLSNVQSINAPARGEDRFDITIGSGSQIDLSSLTTTTSSSAGDTRFDLQSTTPYTLPALSSASHAQFRLTAGSTLNLPMLTTQTAGDYVIPAGSTVNADNLQSLTSATITIDPNGTFNATSLTDLSGSVVTVTPDRTFNTAVITTLDDAQVNVADGIVYDRIAATSYTSNLSRIAFSADGAGTELDLSSLQSLSAPWNDSSGTVRATSISATNGASINLSGVQSINAPVRGEDRFDITIGSGSQIDLSGLMTLTSQSAGDTRLRLEDTAPFTLPALTNANHAQFHLSAASTLSLPVLTTHNAGDYVVPAGAMVNANALQSLTNATLNIQPNGTFNATSLTDLSGSVVTVTPDRTFNTEVITLLDDAQVNVADGMLYDRIGATSYTSNLSRTAFSADGPGTELDLSSLQSLSAPWNDTSGTVRATTISATNGASIDLSNVQSINAPVRAEDRFDIVAESGGTIDLSSLSAVTNQSAGQTRLVVGGGSSIRVGSLVQSDNLRLLLNDTNSALEIAGSLVLDSGSVSVAAGASIQVGGNFSHGYTNEGDFSADAAIFQFDGTGAQQFEVAGTDSGANAFTSGNFGVGQLVIGTTTQRTSVELIEVVDNGNRGINSEPEALYLYGLGGPAGLRIFNNSALVLNGLNVYAHDPLSGDQVHLNSLFQPGELRIPFDDGFLQLVPLDFQWDNNAGGDFNLGGNWSDGLVPLGSDAAIWNLGSVNGYNVQFGTNVATDSAIINSDNVTYQLGGFTYTLAAVNATTGLVVGQNATDNSRLTVAGGMLVTRNARIAAEGGSQGTLTVAADGMLQVDEQLIAGGGQGTLLVEQGGIAQIDGGLSLLAAGRLAGSGQVIGDVDNQAGMISPGQLPGSQTPGQLQVVGNVVQGVDAALEIELGGTDNSDLSNPEYDVLTVDGALTLDGSLTVSLDDLGGGLFAPQDGDLFEVATATSGIDGEFSEFSVPEVAGLTWLLGIGSDSVVLTLTDTPSDFVGNTDIDGGDFLAWQLGFGTVGGATVADGDTNADGNVDGVDLDNWRAQYGFQVIVNTPEINAVPEPSAMLLGLLLTATVATQRWARCPLAPRED